VCLFAIEVLISLFYVSCVWLGLARVYEALYLLAFVLPFPFRSFSFEYVIKMSAQVKTMKKSGSDLVLPNVFNVDILSDVLFLNCPDSYLQISLFIISRSNPFSHSFGK
jgi:hypothetical protein